MFYMLFFLFESDNDKFEWCLLTICIYDILLSFLIDSKEFEPLHIFLELFRLMM